MSLGIFSSYFYIHTVVQRAQIVSLHGEGYTEKDNGAKLRCSMTSVKNTIINFNADGKFHDRERFGRPLKNTLREDHLMRQIVMCSPKSAARKSVLFYA